MRYLNISLPNHCFIIAEIGINHNGDIEIAKKLIDEAKKAGCDAVKFQKRTIDIVYSKEILDSPRESPWGNTQREQKEGLEFGSNEYDEIEKYCKQKNIIWFASAWDTESLKFLDKYNLNYNKIASAMITDLNFLEEVAKRKQHTFISTGMSTSKNIDDAVRIFSENKCSFELMHCVSTYPCKSEDVNLNVIDSLKKKYNCKVGYSGHENGIIISLAAYVKGISSLERHITLDRSMYGSDQSASLELRGMRELMNGIKKMKLSMGDGEIGKILEDEKVIAKKLRAHIK
jgi:N-acetylneuraminate synthase